MRGGGRVWVGVLFVAGAGGVLAACRAPLEQRAIVLDAGATRDDAAPTVQPPGAGRDAAADLGTRAGDAAGARAADAGLAGDAGARDAGAGPDAPARQMAAICPDVEAPAVAPIAPAPPRVPTALPFSCNPMRRGLILPAPPPVTPGLYSRCATFSLGAVEALALSADGRFAAMVNGDGVARIVEIASQQVVALLAPPRARVTRVAFSPDGQRVATVAGGEHEVTVYSTNGWTPLWTVALPGTLYGYTDGFAGAITFSPDSQSLAVSPGANLYLLDLTGVVRASYTSLAILDVAYAWNGQRLVAADASLTGSCIRRPDGGSIVVLDPDSLTKLETVASWAGYSEDNVTPAFRASPTDDLVFVPPSTRDKVPTIQAFKLSDGSELPRPTLTTLPAAFLSNGNLVLAAGGELAVQPVQPVQPVSDATTVEVAVPTPEFPVFAVSADGSTVAVGSDGADLLHVWNVADDYALGVCTLDDTEPGLMSLSADGRAVALGVGGNVQVLRPDDGTPIGTVNGNGQPFQQLMLSRTGRYVAVVEYPPLPPVEDLPTSVIDFLQIIAVPGDGLIADLSRRNAFRGGFLFSPDETTFYDTWFPGGGASAGTLEKIDLGTGKVIATRSVPIDTRPIGFSRGCPVLFDPARGAYRSCDSCDELPVPGTGAVVSPDGTAVLTMDAYPALTTTLWSLPGDQAVHVFGPWTDANGGSWTVDTVPGAATAGGAELLIGTGVDESCYDGPGYQTLLQDASGAILDSLPPGGTPASEDFARLSYGTEIWCRR